MKKRIMFSFLLILPFIISCNENKKEEDLNFKNLNLTILIDLSDRISIKKNPDQVEKDLYIINSVLSAFKKFLYHKGVIQSDDKIKVIFYPINNNSIFQETADSLYIDFEQIELQERKRTFASLNDLFNRNLKKIYSIASQANSYPGSDLFNYFKHRVVDDCILLDSRFINVLVILTDGYLFDENVKYNYGNRYSYIAPLAQHITRFRKMKNWENLFDQMDYGLIKIENDLSRLNILIAEFNPPKAHPEDFDIIKKYWSKWLIEQNVNKSNFKILKTDLNYLNSSIIQKFFENILKRNSAM